MDKKQADRIERKLNFLILISGYGGDWWKGFGADYKGWNAMSAYKDIMEKADKEGGNYLKDNQI